MAIESAAEQDRILAEAADWIVRGEDGFTSDEARAFEIWMSSDDRHREAHRELTELWDELPKLHHLGLSLSLNDNDNSISPDVCVAKRRRRRWIVAVPSAAAAMVAALFLLRPSGPATPIEHYATETAQISKILLADGSIATLGPRTRIDVTFSGSSRRVRLLGGEVFFQVSKDAARPFLIDAGVSQIRVVGTEFDVRRDGGTTRVAVLEGVVQVRSGADGKSDKLLGTLGKGQLAEVVPGAHATPVMRRSSASVDKLTALAGGWRDGWLIYQDAPLSQILDDVRRYYRPGVTATDPAIGELRVTASLKATRIPEFLESLDQQFPITVQRDPDGSFSLGKHR